MLVHAQHSSYTAVQRENDCDTHSENESEMESRKCSARVKYANVSKSGSFQYIWLYFNVCMWIHPHISVFTQKERETEKRIYHLEQRQTHNLSVSKAIAITTAI